MDIIAENQTERTIQTLMNGDADAKTQQIALAAVLRATTTQARELEAIKQNLWKPGDLEKAVEAQLRMKCQNCPARQAQIDESTKQSHNWLTTLLTSDSFRYFLLVIMFAWALILLTIGRDGMKAVSEETRATLTGGISN